MFLARIALFIPALIAGWFVAQDDPRYWVIAFVIALIFMASGIAVWLYLPRLGPWLKSRK